MKAEFRESLPDGSSVFIRPITSSDIERERAFVNGLSKQTRYNRFLGGVSHLSEDQLARFCDVDQVHDMAFIALLEGDAENRQIGVARYVADADEKQAEIAVTVGDDWQNRGVDDAMLGHLIDYAREKGIGTIYSLDLAGNTSMSALAKRFGFVSTTDPDDTRILVHTLKINSSDQQQ